MKKTLSIDFDGTIVEHEFPNIGPLIDGAKEALQRLSKKYEIVISSCRASRLFNHPGQKNPHLEEMIEFLDANEIPYDRIDMGNEGKVVAEYYIDDRAITFRDNWGTISRELMK